MTRVPTFAVLLLSLAGGSLAFPVAEAAAQVEAIPEGLQLAAAPGLRTAGSGTTAFCPAGVLPLEPRETRAARLRDVLDLRHAVEGGGRFSLTDAPDYRTVVRLACAHASDANARAWVAAYRQLLVNATGADDAAIDELLRASAAGTDRQFALACEPLAAPAGAPADVTLRARIVQQLACNEGRLEPLGAMLYWLDRPGALDAGASLPALSRAALVRTALAVWQANGVTDAPTANPRNGSLAAWVAVRNDIDAIDPDAARRELLTSGLGPLERAVALMSVYRTRMVASRGRAAWLEVARADPRLAPFVDELPRRASADWDTEVGAHASAVAEAYAVERAWLTHDTASARGCDARLRAEWLTYAGAAGAHTPDQLRALFDRPVGYLLAAAMTRCEHDLGHLGRARAVFDLLDRVAPQRGPRFLAIHALRRAVFELHAADPRFPVASGPMDPMAQIQSDDDWVESARTSGHGASEGVVQSVRPEGDDVRVTFRYTTAQLPVFQCTPTGRIARIERDGTVAYERSCVVVGHETIDATPEPVVVPRELATGIEGGAWLVARREANGAVGLPLEVRASVDAPARVFLGIALR